MVEINNQQYSNLFKEYLEKTKANVEPNKISDQNQIEDSKRKNEHIIRNANNWFLINILSPEIQRNEKKKRIHKDWLMWIMGGFIFLQFIIVAVMVCYSGYHIINSHINGNPFSDSTIKIIATFIGTYITSVIIELIAILNYIVKNVFDTSVAGMVNNFKDNIEEEKK